MEILTSVEEFLGKHLPAKGAAATAAAASVDADAKFARCLERSLSVAERCLDLYEEKNELAFSFNGGKDSTVVLHLLRAAAWRSARRKVSHSSRDEGGQGEGHDRDPRLASEYASIMDRVYTFYFESDDHFQEEVDFVRSTTHPSAEGGCDLSVNFLSQGFKEGLELMVSRSGRSTGVEGGLGVRAIMMGTRRTDPDGRGLEIFSPSSVGWPAFMRVNPILYWDYAMVWRFLHLVKVPYCSLYDQGYTSIGSIHDTVPNPELVKAAKDAASAAASGASTAAGGADSVFVGGSEDGSNGVVALPAHHLVNGASERAGRTKRKKKKKDNEKGEEEKKA